MIDEVEDDDREKRFWELVRAGASIVAHPDTIAEIERAIIADVNRTSIGVWSAWGVRFIPNKYIDYGKLIAVPKLKFKMPNFRFSDDSVVDDLEPFQRVIRSRTPNQLGQLRNPFTWSKSA